MSRPKLPTQIETAILVRSRRRCCICFGLNRDTELKAGQIAHLDHQSSNQSEGNLAFLCFNHHDSYDSTTSQSKNLTIGEVKSFRDELYDNLNRAFEQRVHFGLISTPPADPFAGTYIRIGTNAASADLTLTPLPDSPEGHIQYFVSGMALMGEDRPYGPNMGFLEFVGQISESSIIFQRELFPEEIAITTLRIEGHCMTVKEENVLGAYGMGVTFEGFYQKSASPHR